MFKLIKDFDLFHSAVHLTSKHCLVVKISIFFIPHQLLTDAFWLWSTPLSVFLAPYSRSSYHFIHIFVMTPEMNILHTLITYSSSVSITDFPWILTKGFCQ